MNKKTYQYRVEMKKRKRRRRNPTPYTPLEDRCTGQPIPQLIGWYNFATGVILTPNFTPSLGGSEQKPNRAHDRRVRALDLRIKAAQRAQAS